MTTQVCNWYYHIVLRAVCLSEKPQRRPAVTNLFRCKRITVSGWDSSKSDLGGADFVLEFVLNSKCDTRRKWTRPGGLFVSRALSQPTSFFGSCRNRRDGKVTWLAEDNCYRGTSAQRAPSLKCRFRTWYDAWTRYIVSQHCRNVFLCRQGLN